MTNNNRLAWVPEFFSSIARATDGSFKGYEISTTVDPLKVLVKFLLRHDLPEGSYKPFQHIAHAFAQANDCLMERIRKVPGAYVMEVLTKRRVGSVSKNNPLVSKRNVR